MTAAERLVSLAGGSGAAGVLLLAIGSGATAGAALVNYSGLPSGTAAEHLMADIVTIGGGWHGDDVGEDIRVIKRPGFNHEDEEDLMAILAAFIQIQDRAL